MRQEKHLSIEGIAISNIKYTSKTSRKQQATTPLAMRQKLYKVPLLTTTKKLQLFLA
jgi:hypothetical protein